MKKMESWMIYSNIFLWCLLVLFQACKRISDMQVGEMWEEWEISFCSHRISEVGNDLWVQPVTQDKLSHGTECQGQGVRNSLGLPSCNHPFHEEILPLVQPRSPLVQFKAVSCSVPGRRGCPYLATSYFQAECDSCLWLNTYLINRQNILVYCNNIPLFIWQQSETLVFSHEWPKS